MRFWVRAGVAYGVLMALCAALFFPGVAWAYTLPAEDTTATPVVGSVESSGVVSVVGTVTLSASSVDAIADALEAREFSARISGSLVSTDTTAALPVTVQGVAPLSDLEWRIALCLFGGVLGFAAYRGVGNLWSVHRD